MKHPTGLVLVVVATLAACALAACALVQGPPLARGQTLAEVQALLGAPSGRYELPGGLTRLEFARGPYGRQTWMVDLGADGRVAAYDQVLNEMHFAEFAQRAPGMTRDELLRTLGRPAERRHGGWAGGEIWSYRYPTNDCLWFQVTLGEDTRVRAGSYGIDPACDVNDKAPAPSR